MANLSNINNRLIVTDGGNLLVNATANLATYGGITIDNFSDPSIAMKTTGTSGWLWTQYITSTGTNNFSMGVNQSSPYWCVKAGAGMDSPHLVVNSSGNVGIGTISPTSPTSVGTFLEIRGRNGIGGGTAGIVLKDYDNDGWDIWNSGGQLNFRYNNDGAVGFFITSAGDTTFAGKVNIQGNPPITANANFNDLVITDSGNSGISIFSGNANDGAIYFGDTDANNSGQFKYLHGSNKMTFATSDADRLFIEVNGIYPPTGPITGTTYYGYNAGLGSAGTSHNTYYGYYAGRANTGTRNVFMGSQTAYAGTNNLNYNVLIGYNVLRVAANTCESNVVIGDSTAGNSSGFSSSVVIGQAAGNSMTGNSNTVVGYGAYYGVSTGQSNIIMGYQAANAANMSNAIIIGFRAGYVNQGNQIVCIGNEAGRNNIGGVSNVFIGTDAGYGNVSGNSNTYVGSQSGVYQTGYYNTALGHFALYGLSGASNASYNTALGYYAGKSITSGAENTLIGRGAGAALTTGAYNVAIGNLALYNDNGSNHNIAIGRASMQSASGGNNIGVGTDTLEVASGSDNTAVGYRAAPSVSSAERNTFIGGLSGHLTTTGSYNTAIGYGSYQGYPGYENTGDDNTALGYFAMGGNNVSGNDNTAVGMRALMTLNAGANNVAVGVDALKVVQGGPGNTAIGANAGNNITSGNNNTCLGNGAVTPSNSSTNTIVLGDSSVSSLQCQVQTISGLSDRRDKTNIKDSEYGLDLISSLKPVTFEWNQRDGQRKSLKDLGFIAQDLQKVDDEHLSFVSDEDPEKLTASYGRLIPVMVKAIQELKAEIEILKNK
jgi:hypothetical protein